MGSRPFCLLRFGCDVAVVGGPLCGAVRKGELDGAGRVGVNSPVYWAVSYARNEPGGRNAPGDIERNRVEETEL